MFLVLLRQDNTISSFFVVAVAWIYLVLYLKKIILLNIYVLYCLVLLNRVLFYLVCFDSRNEDFHNKMQ